MNTTEEDLMVAIYGDKNHFNGNYPSLEDILKDAITHITKLDLEIQLLEETLDEYRENP